MTQPTAEWERLYGKQRAFLFGHDGGLSWNALNIDVDGKVYSKGQMWQASSLSFVNLQADADGRLTVSGVFSDTPLALVIYEDGSVLYLCKAPIGSALNSAVWQIQKIDTGSVPMRIYWCDSNSNFDNLASNLATVQGHTYG